MPNWCETDVTITGSNEDIEAFIAKATAGYLIPEPKDDDVQGESLMPMDIGKMVSEGRISFGAVIGVPSDYAINWYERGLELWGTKWDCSGPERADILTTDGCANFRISTPWSPPEVGVKAWAQAFPRLRFTCKVSEEAFLYAGVFIAQGEGYVEDYYDPADLLNSLPSTDGVHSAYDFEDDPSEIYEALSHYVDSQNIIRLANLLAG